MATFNLKTEATKTLYAGAGVADLAVETVRDVVADAQKRFTELTKDVQTRVSGVQKSVTEIDPTELQKQAVTTVNSRVDALTAEAKTRRTAVEKRVAELQAEAATLPGKAQKAVDDNVAVAISAYDDLAKRGQVLVGRIRRQESTKATESAAKTTATKAKTTTTQAKKATKTTAKKASTASKSAAKSTTTTAKKSAAPTKSSAKSTTTAAKKAASNATTAASDAAKKVGD